MRENTWIGKLESLQDTERNAGGGNGGTVAQSLEAAPAAALGADRLPAVAIQLAPDGQNNDLIDLFVDYFSKKQPVDLKPLIDRIEKRIIISVLIRAQGNQKEAARALGLKYTTLNEKVKKYGIRFRRRIVPFSLDAL